MGDEVTTPEGPVVSTQSLSKLRYEPVRLILVSRPVPRCSCGGELVITGEIRNAEGWRTGFKLQCKNCSKRWTYSGGIYRADLTAA